MPFYDLTEEERQKVVDQIYNDVFEDLKNNEINQISSYFSDQDTHIRKSAYLAVGKIYKEYPSYHHTIISCLSQLLQEEKVEVRQTTINAAGEIGMVDFDIIENILEQGLFDEHHQIRNAVIGSIKKMGQTNPKPTLAFARRFLHHPDKEIRREICQGIELRGRTHPEDILPILKELEFDKTERVKNTLIHVIGQISYKKGCLEKVIEHLKTWENEKLVSKAINEILDVHIRYKDLSKKTFEEAKEYIENNW
ncbi:HEAT repeat domain-containing protein [Bacteroidales bacterium AH-315-N07]|nr:HEAT repeat domain-containing protein [Bacteroidales bacterium AH-315-N07]